MEKEPTPEQVARAALAQLTKSVKQTTKLSSADARDKQLRQLSNYRQKPSETSTPNSPASTTLMEKLWVLMSGLYGHKWISSYGTSDTKLDENGQPRADSGIWGKALAGINGLQIAQGVQACSRLTGDDAEWPPSAPKFRELCLTSSSNLGIPTVDAAWREAVEASGDVLNFKFSHPIVQEAGRLTDWYSIRTGTPKAETVQNRFNKRYADLTAKLQRGEPLVEGQLLISQENAQCERERAEKANDQIVLDRIKAQGLDRLSSEQLREQMRAKLGIKR